MRTYPIGVAGLVFCVAAIAQYACAEETAVELAGLSLEALMDLEVTSVSKKAQPLVDAPAAVFVITAEDIRRAGVTTLGDALRMVPGVSVAKVDASKWAITARGFADRFANKLLVLLDGRLLYSTLFSGVYWEQQDTLMEDIDRIEFIRGPGATLWGANAVNGVINIITKRPAATQGTLLTVGAGDEEELMTGFRYGDMLGEHGAYRIYAKQFERDAGVDAAGQPAYDAWHGHQFGFRYQDTLNDTDALTVQGDVYRQYVRQSVVRAGMPGKDSYRPEGWNVLCRWERTSKRDTSLKLGYDANNRYTDAVAGIIEHTLDLDLQQRFRPADGHEVVWGAAFKYYHSVEPLSGRSGNFVSGLVPQARDTKTYSGFIQDDIASSNPNLRWTVGSKFEQNDFTGFEVQPSVRVLYTPDDRQAWWGALSRAVRTPGVVEDDFRRAAAFYDPAKASTATLAAAGDGLAKLALDPVNNPAGLPVVAALVGDRNFDVEKLLAYEAGYRVRPRQDLYLDLAAFYHDYDNLRSLELRTDQIGDPALAGLFTGMSVPPPHLVAPFRPGNNGTGQTYGLELAADWRVTNRWRLQAAYTYLKANLDLAVQPGSAAVYFWEYEGNAPQNQFSLRSSADLDDKLDLDLWLRYTDSLPTLNVDSYLTLDARIGWRPRPGLEAALIGRNLLQSSHFEYGTDVVGTQPTQTERSFAATLTWRF